MKKNVTQRSLQSFLVGIFLVSQLVVKGITVGTVIDVDKNYIQTKMSKTEMADKMKGGWNGKVIGCTFGGPSEFRFNGTMIQDYQPIPWDKYRCKWYYENEPGLYDDLYVNLTYLDIFEKEGLQTSASSLANAFAHARYELWYSFQAARYNILRGLMPPKSGFWLNNMNTEDIGFQIAADFAGLISPGMVNTASEICDKAGHITHYGDGWYGGVYVAAMYSLAFVSNDLEYIITEGLKTIPDQSNFYKCISDVIRWWKQYPDDWKQTWFEIQKKWTEDIGHPDFVFSATNMDAKLNAAHVIVGLLYGKGNFGKTLEISTRCGDDSDCNAATACGILGTILGYSHIPEIWKEAVSEVEDIDFKYTEMSLNDIYSLGYKLALENLKMNKANILGDSVEIPFQKIEQVKIEIAYRGHFLKDKITIGKELNEKASDLFIDFEGNGFAISGSAEKVSIERPDFIFNLEMYIDGKKTDMFDMPTNKLIRRNELAWKFQLPEGKHQVKIKLLNPKNDYWLKVGELVTYSSKEENNALIE